MLAFTSDGQWRRAPYGCNRRPAPLVRRSRPAEGTFDALRHLPQEWCRLETDITPQAGNRRVGRAAPSKNAPLIATTAPSWIEQVQRRLV